MCDTELFYGVTINGELYQVWGGGVQDAVCDACRFYKEDNHLQANTPLVITQVVIY